MLYKLFRPLIFLQDPEKAHEKVIRFGQYLGNKDPLNLENFFNYENNKLNTTVCGIDFKNPIGLAAGFDKNAVITRFIESLGFGFEEVGSVTKLGGEGNEKPRLFRLVKDEAIINQMGLNNHGAYSINENLERRTSKFPIGVNIAKTHSPDILGDKGIMDYIGAYNNLREGDYVTLNVSCPNVKGGKTFEDPRVLKDLLLGIDGLREAIQDTRPLFVKFSPDINDNDLDKVLQVCEEMKVSGYIFGNTSASREGLKTFKRRLNEIGMGGLSGKPIRDKSTQLISKVYRLTKKPIIGVGGIFNAEDAYKKIKAGACLVQVFTGMIYEGPSIAKNINQGLVKLLKRDGFKNIKEAIGTFQTDFS